MWHDPIVEEVRRVRRAIEAECDDDLAKICQHLRDAEKALGSRLVNRGPVRLERPGDTGTSRT